MLKTWDEWKLEGKYVIKGQHACLRENGRCYFNETQVITLDDIKKYGKEQLKRFEKETDRQYQELCDITLNDWGNETSLNDFDRYKWLSRVATSTYNKHSNTESIGLIDASKVTFGHEDNYLFDLI